MRASQASRASRRSHGRRWHVRAGFVAGGCLARCRWPAGDRGCRSRGARLRRHSPPAAGARLPCRSRVGAAGGGLRTANARGAVAARRLRGSLQPPVRRLSKTMSGSTGRRFAARAAQALADVIAFAGSRLASGAGCRRWQRVGCGAMAMSASAVCGSRPIRLELLRKPSRQHRRRRPAALPKPCVPALRTGRPRWPRGNGRSCQAMPTASASEAAIPNATGQRRCRPARRRRAPRRRARRRGCVRPAPATVRRADPSRARRCASARSSGVSVRIGVHVGRGIHSGNLARSLSIA